jgi:hypothetical protein
MLLIHNAISNNAKITVDVTNNVPTTIIKNYWMHHSTYYNNKF